MPCLQELNEYQRGTQVSRMPSLLEYGSYIFACGNLLAGAVLVLCVVAFSLVRSEGPY